MVYSDFEKAGLQEAIVEMIADGTPMADVCRIPGFPSVTTVWNWEREDAAFAERVAHARRAGCDRIAADALRIANTPLMGEEDEDGHGPQGSFSKTVRKEMLGHRKLQVETRLKLLACWDPRYAQKQQLEHSGPGGGAVPIVALTTTDPNEAARIYQQMVQGLTGPSK